MFYFFITFTTVCQGLSVLGLCRLSGTEGFKLCGLTIWFLIPTKWPRQESCMHIFSFSLNIDTFQRAMVACVVGDEEIG